MKVSELAWLTIRISGLLLVTYSVFLGLATISLSISAHQHGTFREYPAGIQEGTNVPSLKRDLEVSRKLEFEAMEKGLRFVFCIVPGLYLLFGGQAVHKIVTRFPQPNSGYDENSE